MNRKHGHGGGGGSPTYRSWCALRSRVAHHPDYIARAIGCCDRWSVFANFLADMGERPAGMSIERKDNARGYEPGNCVWGTRKDQSRNRRGRRMVTFRGEQLILAEAIERSGISKRLFEQRVYGRGWAVERALETPRRAHA